MPKKTGICGKCNKECHYIVASTYASFWVHSDTGDFVSYFPEKHDVNTFVIKNKD